MIKVLLTVAVLGSLGSFAGPAMAQGQQGEASLLAKLEAQCAHRRMMPPDPRDDCANKLKLRSDAQLASGQGDASAAVAGPGNGGGQGNGNGRGQGNGIGPGSG